MKFILGKKLNMSSVFTANGEKIPVTVIQAGPCKVVQIKTADKDGYKAVQIGFGSKRHLNKAATGHQKGTKFSYLREFPIKEGADIKVGQEVLASNFEQGDFVSVSGIMKGRGFTGAVKRHGFHGAPATHGHDHPRAVGSIGSRYPQHTLKGTRMAGRYGGNAVTVKNLQVIDIDAEKNLIWIKGAVPGSRGGLVKIQSTGEKGDVGALFMREEKKVEAPEVKAAEPKSEAAEPEKV